MGIKRIVDTEFWEDGSVIDKYSVEDKYFLLYLMTNPRSSQVGIYKLPKRIISFETGYTVEVIAVLLQRFETKYKNIVYNNETQEIAVLNSLKYSIVKGGKPVSDLLQKELSKIDDTNLILQTYTHLLSFWEKSLREFDKNIREIFEMELLKRKVPKENINDKENDNDNDNEDSYHESCHESSYESSSIKKKGKPHTIRHKYGEYKNVLLSDDQLEKLKSEFPNDWEQRIDRVSEYCESTGKTYKNYLATIRNWAKKDKTQPNQPIRKKQPFVRQEKLPEWANEPVNYSRNKPKVTEEDRRRFLDVSGREEGF